MANDFIRMAQMFMQDSDLKPIITDVIETLKLPGMKGIGQVEVSGGMDSTYIYFQVDIDPKFYQSVAANKSLTEDEVKGKVKMALEQHFPANQFHVSFGFFPALKY
jgi:hypothetical protein